MFLGTISSKNNGKSLTIQELNQTAVSLGLPENQPFLQRRIARAYDLVQSNKVSQIDWVRCVDTTPSTGIFRVRSQYEPDKSYIVNLNHGEPSCNCPDGERTINCKHRIASLLWLCNQEQSNKRVVGMGNERMPLLVTWHASARFSAGEGVVSTHRTLALSTQAVKVTWDDTENSYHKRGRWWVTDYKRRIKYIIYRDSDGNLHCPCGRKPDCEHRKAIREYLGNDGGGNLTWKRAVALPRFKRIANECGSNEAKALQDNLNAQIDSQNGNGNGAQKAPSQLDLSDPFQESEQYDIDQIEGRRDSELAWKLSNGEYVISYKGIMTLAEKHNIEFSVSLHDDTNTWKRAVALPRFVIAKAMNGNERVSGKEIKIAGSIETASELAKRSAARQLLPYAELRAVEKKAQLEAEFDWQKAKAKCEDWFTCVNTVELVGEANVGIIIHDLTQAGKLRQDNPSHYNRLEWLQIFQSCKRDAQVERDPKSLNRWSYNSAEFLETCREAIAKVREEKKSIDELPPQNGDGKRKVQMDKKLKTWLIEADGTKKPISCREIAEQYDSYEKGIITRLRAGIDSGADFSTVELN